jgi:hypothetical protein
MNAKVLHKAKVYKIHLHLYPFHKASLQLCSSLLLPVLELNLQKDGLQLGDSLLMSLIQYLLVHVYQVFEHLSKDYEGDEHAGSILLVLKPNVILNESLPFILENIPSLQMQFFRFSILDDLHLLPLQGSGNHHLSHLTQV